MNKPSAYPKVMRHPDYAPAVIEKEDGPEKGLFRAGGRQISPARYPEITVRTKEDEQKEAARGYRPAGGYDPEEYERTILEGSVNTAGRGAAYPKWKYSPTEMPVIAQHEGEERALDGVWFDSPSDAENYEATAEEVDEEQADMGIPISQTDLSKLDKRSKVYRDAVKAKHT